MNIWHDITKETPPIGECVCVFYGMMDLLQQIYGINQISLMLSFKSIGVFQKNFYQLNLKNHNRKGRLTMSKIAKQKALEAYPIIEGNSIDWGQYEDLNEDTREAYIEGYNQAFQDFLEKAEEFLYLQLNNGSIECGNIERLIEQFKNYMQNENEN